VSSVTYWLPEIR